jgi:ribosome-binding protein aMBF1 (putative translation factor)
LPPQAGNYQAIQPTVYCLFLIHSLVSNVSVGKMRGEEKLLRVLGERVRELRKEMGFSQEKLAELADIHVNHLRRVELGQANPTYLVLTRVASALSTSVQQLLP